LLEDYKVKKQQLEMVTSVMEELIMQMNILMRQSRLSSLD